ncbi:uncharacterized protein [Pempheris klunzingeri]|uniref:uncharacterized protein n=1 Tax=Pempheris klunzingeri TaxID=3127111 RepID=UPI00397F96C2
MSRVQRIQKLRVFISQRLNAALEEILTVFEETIVKHEEEAALCQEVISRQHALLCALHKPVMEPPTSDVLMQQPDPPEHQNQEHQLHLDEADIIQFTYKPRSAARPGQDPSATRTTWAELGPADPDSDVQTSETEDSDDYSRDTTDTRTASNQPEPQVIRGPGAAQSSKVRNRTFRARRVLVQHLKVHQQEAEPEPQNQTRTTQRRKGGPENQTRTTQRRKGGLENQSRIREREEGGHQNFQPNTITRIQLGEDPHTCDDCGKKFLQVWRKRRHRCPPPQRKNHQSPEVTTQTP